MKYDWSRKSQLKHLKWGVSRPGDEVLSWFLRRLDLSSEGVKLISHSGNSVYRVSPQNLILRITDLSFRSKVELQAELDFLIFLKREGLEVQSVREYGGQIFWVHPEGKFGASLFEFLEGEVPQRNAYTSHQNLIYAWGQELSRLHGLSRLYQLKAGEISRWHWREEGLILDAERLLPGWDSAAREEGDRLLDQIFESELVLSHGDFAPGNFLIHPVYGVRSFDFGNLCYHDPVSDLAIAATLFRAFPKGTRDSLKDALFEGYASISQLPAMDQWELYLKLRYFYVYLSRLHLFGPTPSEEEGKMLERIRNRFLHPVVF